MIPVKGQQTKKILLMGCRESQIVYLAFVGTNENLLTAAEHLCCCCLDYISVDLFGWGVFFPLFLIPCKDPPPALPAGRAPGPKL